MTLQSQKPQTNSYYKFAESIKILSNKCFPACIYISQINLANTKEQYLTLKTRKDDYIMIEFMEKSKSLNETIDFNKDNIFERVS